MERENDRNLEHSELLEEKRLKLDYVDLKGDTAESWDSVLSSAWSELSLAGLRDTVTQGVPQVRRGEVWTLLVSKHDNDLEQFTEQFPNMTATYDNLKSQLTSHQHAILIDLGKITSLLISF